MLIDRVQGKQPLCCHFRPHLFFLNSETTGPFNLNFSLETHSEPESELQSKFSVSTDPRSWLARTGTLACAFLSGLLGTFSMEIKLLLNETATFPRPHTQLVWDNHRALRKWGNMVPVLKLPLSSKHFSSSTKLVPFRSVGPEVHVSWAFVFTLGSPHQWS